MELIMEHADMIDMSNEGTAEELKQWIENNAEAIKAIYTLANIEPTHRGEWHTYQDFSAWGGNEGVIIDITINGDEIDFIVLDHEWEKQQCTVDGATGKITSARTIED